MRIALLVTLVLALSACSGRKIMRCPEHVQDDLYWCEKP